MTNKILITEEQAKEIAEEESKDFETYDECENDDDSEGRWHEKLYTFFKDKNGILYRMKWERGLTENVGDEFFSQECPEVEKYEETIVLTKYRIKE